MDLPLRGREHGDPARRPQRAARGETVALHLRAQPRRDRRRRRPRGVRRRPPRAGQELAGDQFLIRLPPASARIEAETAAQELALSFGSLTSCLSLSDIGSWTLMPLGGIGFSNHLV